MLKVLLIFSAALLVSVPAQRPRPCESPREWEGRFRRYDEKRKFRQLAKITYDEPNKRVREIEELAIGSKDDFYNVIRLYNERKEYRLNLRTRLCNTTTLTRPFVPFGLPPNANFSSSFVIGVTGLSDENVEALSFDGTQSGVQYYGIVSTPSCAPIQTGISSASIGNEETQFFDIKAGVVNPNDFIPPKECQ